MAYSTGRVSDAWSVFTDVPSAPGSAAPANADEGSWFGGVFDGFTDFLSGAADTGFNIWNRITTTQVQQDQAAAQTAMAQAQSLNAGANNMMPLLIAGGVALAAVVVLKK